MKVRVSDVNRFISSVFGADDIIKYFPAILTTGVEIQKIDEFYYICENGKPAHDTAFFSDEEMDSLIQI